MKLFKIFIASLLITTAAQAAYNVPSGSITTAKIADGAVTSAKKAAVNIANSSTINVSTGSTTMVDVTGSSLTLITTGRTVLIVLMPVGTNGSNGTLFANCTGCTEQVQLIRDSTRVGSFTFANGASAVIRVPCGQTWIDTPSAASHIYKLQYSTSSGLIQIDTCQLLAFEL